MNGLLVCTESDEAAVLGYALHRTGAAISTVDSLTKLEVRLDEGRFDLVVLAARFDPLLTRQVVRRHSEAMLVLILDVCQEELAIKALDEGADLVLVRPYSIALFIAQVRALLRRSRVRPAADLPKHMVGLLRLDPTSRVVQFGDREPRRLTQLEFRLLHTLMMNEGRIVTTASIVERVWGFDGAGGMELVRGLVRRLRAKVECDPRHPRLILTEPGIGYRLDSSSLEPEEYLKVSGAADLDTSLEQSGD